MLKYSLRLLCVLCVSAVNVSFVLRNRRDAENAEKTQRSPDANDTWKQSVIRRLCQKSDNHQFLFVLVRAISRIVCYPPKSTIHEIGRTNTNKATNQIRYLTRPNCFKLRLLVLIFLLLFPTQTSNSQTPNPTGVLRLRVKVKIGESTKSLARKRFYLIKGTLEQNKTMIDAAEQSPYLSRDCFYSKLGASQQLIGWLKAGDCESVYCREIDEEFLSGPKAVPEFVAAYAAGEKEFGQSNIGRKWLTNNLPPPLRDGFYQDRRNALDALLKQAEMASGTRPLSTMTDRNGTAYLTDLEPGIYVLTSLLPIEVGASLDSWKCELQIKPGDIATETPYQVSNRKDRLVKCVAVEKPIPVCQK